MVSWVFLLVACSPKVSVEKSKATVASSTTSSTGTSSREDCMTGCKVMWNSNAGNAGKSENEMMLQCNSLCDAGQGMQNNDVASCEKAEGVLRDTCFSDVARNTNNPELCKKITQTMLINTCYIGIVEKTKDTSLCENISVNYMKEVCLEK